MTVIHATPFYFASIRKIVASFGTVFNNISIQRKDSGDVLQNDFKVPVGFGSKQHWYNRIEKGVMTEEGGVQTAMIVPRIGYMLKGLNYDSSKKLIRNNRNKRDIQTLGTGEKIRKNQYVPVPYKLEFELSVYSKNMDDGLQILEQFIPYFSPTVNLRILEIEELDLWNDVQISMSPGITLNDAIEDGFTSRRTITWDFSFSVSANLYPPITQQKVILTSIMDIDNLDPVYDLETITVAANTGETSNKENSTTTIELDV